jgi:hypothetical protein
MKLTFLNTYSTRSLQGTVPVPVHEVCGCSTMNGNLSKGGILRTVTDTRKIKICHAFEIFRYHFVSSMNVARAFVLVFCALSSPALPDY